MSSDDFIARAMAARSAMTASTGRERAKQKSIRSDFAAATAADFAAMKLRFEATGDVADDDADDAADANAATTTTTDVSATTNTTVANAVTAVDVVDDDDDDDDDDGDGDEDDDDGDDDADDDVDDDVDDDDGAGGDDAAPEALTGLRLARAAAATAAAADAATNNDVTNNDVDVSGGVLNAKRRPPCRYDSARETVVLRTEPLWFSEDDVDVLPTAADSNDDGDDDDDDGDAGGSGIGEGHGDGKDKGVGGDDGGGQFAADTAGKVANAEFVKRRANMLSRASYLLAIGDAAAAVALCEPFVSAAGDNSGG
jgi:hypothetical protein